MKDKKILTPKELNITVNTMDDFEAGTFCFTQYEHLHELAVKLAEMNDEANEDMQWMSGSADFSPSGKAHKGWLKVRERLFKRINALQQFRRAQEAKE